MDAILIGGFIEIIELCELCNINILGIIDNKIEKEYCGYPILGNDNDAKQLSYRFKKIPLILTPDLPATRKKLAYYYSSLGFSFLNLISPRATVSKSSKIGKGVVIQSGANVSANVAIDEFVRLNTNANVMHDCKIGAFTTIAPCAVLLGRGNIGCSCYIGANSTILPDITVEDNAIIAAGAVVVKNVGAGKTVKGIPAK